MDGSISCFLLLAFFLSFFLFSFFLIQGVLTCGSCYFFYFLFFLNICYLLFFSSRGWAGPRSLWRFDFFFMQRAQVVLSIIVVLGYAMVYDIIRMGNGKRYMHEEWSE